MPWLSSIFHCAQRPRLICRLERALLRCSLSDLCSRLVVAQNCCRLYICVFVLTLFVLFWFRCSWSMLPLSRWSVHRGHLHCRRIWKSCVIIPSRWISCAIKSFPHAGMLLRPPLSPQLTFPLIHVARAPVPRIFDVYSRHVLVGFCPVEQRDTAHQILA